MNNIVIIPARGGSKRIPRKNIRDFCGQPIIKYSIDAAKASGLFKRVIVSTDDEEIAAISKQAGAEVPFMRSEKNADDFATTADVILEVLERLGGDFNHLCCLYAAAPFVDSAVLKKTYELFIRENAGSVFSAVKYGHPIQRAFRIENNRAVIESSAMRSRTQDLEPYYHDAGQFYWADTKKFLKNKSVFMDRTYCFILDPNRVQDIDDEDDWRLAERKYQGKRILNICFMGSNQAGLIGLSNALARGHRVIKAVVYDKNLRKFANTLGIPCADRIDSVEFRQALQDSDVLLSVHGKEIVKKDLLRMPRIGSVNIHPFLYKYKGPDPVGRALRDKETKASVGAHLMTENIDEGKVLEEVFFEIQSLATVGDIYNQLYPYYVEVIQKVLERFEDEREKSNIYHC